MSDFVELCEESFEAPEELSSLLRGLADQVDSALPLRRIRYGPAAVKLLKRQSPEGFLIDSSHGDLQMLLPDGRLWAYRRQDFAHPQGLFYDARVDYVNFVHSRMTVEGVQFAYLGATIGKYSFGAVCHDRPHLSPRSGSLCALNSSAGGSRLVEPNVAAAEIASWLRAQSR